MSSLSWLIYFVGLSETISTSFGWVIAALVIVSLGLTITKFVFMVCSEDNDVHKVDARFGPGVRHWAIFVYFCLFLSILVQFAMPSKQTAVLIAASEVGQRVLQTQQAQAVGDKVGAVLDNSTQLLQTWIKKETINQQQQFDDLVKSHDTKK